MGPEHCEASKETDKRSWFWNSKPHLKTTLYSILQFYTMIGNIKHTHMKCT